MKNVIKHSKKGILLVTLFATLLSFANEAKFLNDKNEARTSLTLKNVKEGNLLSIKDDNGLTLYKEQILKAGIYSKGFDLTALPDGAYVFEVEKDMEINIIPFYVKLKKVIFDKEKEKTIFKPYFEVKDNLLHLTKLSLNEAPLRIDFYFSDLNDYKLVHSELIENTQNIKKIFKLINLNKGSYKIVTHSEGREFTKIIK